MSKRDDRFYITTAIDYVNSVPHIGTAYEKIGADVLARWNRMMGKEVHFQMGNDEHSINVWKAAREKGLSPKQYCDEMKTKFEDVWKSLSISYDGFIQTSDPSHEAGVQKLFSKIMESGDIYSARYEGWYCESCEAYLTDKDLAEGLCPNHKTKPKWLSEENYFFALSKYGDRLLKHIEKNPDFILPDIRKNEIVSLIREGLQDVSVSRSSFDWGVKLPNDDNHIVYVWFDALINYITAVGYGSNEENFKKWWPADIHVIGKDITRFHCVIWPAMLMSAGLELPKTVFGHGFVYLKGEKMSKSLGNVVKPMDIIGKFGADPLRYYLMREGGFGRDGDFTWEHFIERYNGDLANGIGNLVARTIGMATRYQDCIIDPPSKIEPSSEIASTANGLFEKLSANLNHLNGEVEFHHALANIWELVASADRHVNENKPWELAKKNENERINTILWELASAIRVVATALFPFMPSTAKKIWSDMGFEIFGSLAEQGASSLKSPWGNIDKKIIVKKVDGLFPRIEEDENKDKPDAKKIETPKKEKKMETASENVVQLLDIQDFAKVELKVAAVIEAEKVEGADKLLKLIIDIGSEKRQIVAGIAKHYSPEELVGKKIVVVTNLKPAKLRGIESNGMLLAASDENTVSILTPLRDVAIGSKIK
ncbi:MAG TPA: methionine--tRNA ligase [bacterium]|nr:methionine--tRNA ligase [bacterium]HQC50837.1 methionine--tRNA ligase [bacterium]